MICQSTRDSPSCRQGLAHALHAPVAVGESAVLLREAGRGQDHVRQLAGLVHEDVDADDEVQRFHGVLRVAEIGLAHQVDFRP